ncbi:hypothetical protein CASFOL_041248 [Castilleja foliolosa]|uniref:Uncharacterized protein n=1 Tax=Castilleja foliolosa TaxID=1961234 RepID=A0ABD3BFK9_9LAMI
MMSESFRRLQARKMSKKRAMSGGSAKEMTVSKRKSTVTKPVDEFIFCEEGVTNHIDTFLNTRPSAYSPIFDLFKAQLGVKFMVDKILENPSGFLDIAELRMKAFLKFVDEKVPISSEDEKSLLREVWLHPCFCRSLAAAIDDDDWMICTIMDYQKQVSVAERIDLMVADSRFKPSVMGLKKTTSRSTFLRLFLSILIGFWGDEGLLLELDENMGKDRFGRRLDIIAKIKARALERAGKKDETEEFSFVIEDISHAKDMEPLRKLMVERYGAREDRDIEAILKKIKLYDLLTMTGDPLCYEGMKVEIDIVVINGDHSLVFTNIIPK